MQEDTSSESDRASTWSWVAHPVRERPAAAAGAAVVIALLCVLSARLMGEAAFGLLAAAVLAFALRRFFLPSRYTVGADGIEVRTPWARRELRWREVDRFLYGPRGGFLVERGAGSRFSAPRGLHLLFGKHGDEAIDRIQRFLHDQRAGERG